MIVETEKTIALAKEYLGTSRADPIASAIQKGSSIIVRASVLAERTLVVDFSPPTAASLSNKEEIDLLDLCDAIEERIDEFFPTGSVH